MSSAEWIEIGVLREVAMRLKVKEEVSVEWLRTQGATASAVTVSRWLQMFLVTFAKSGKIYCISDFEIRRFNLRNEPETFGSLS